MKGINLCFFAVFMTAFSYQLQAQAGFGNRNGTRGSSLPQAQAPPAEPEKLTAQEIVDRQMPKLVEVIGLDPFEEAVVRSVLEDSVQKRMELQILQLEPNKMKEEYQKIGLEQDEALKAGLPQEKYDIYLDMKENPTKTKRKQKKKKKNKKSKESL